MVLILGGGGGKSWNCALDAMVMARSGFESGLPNCSMLQCAPKGCAITAKRMFCARSHGVWAPRTLRRGKKEQNLSSQKHTAMKDRMKGNSFEISRRRDCEWPGTWLALVAAETEETFESITNHLTSEVVPCMIAQLSFVPGKWLEEIEVDGPTSRARCWSYCKWLKLLSGRLWRRGGDWLLMHA